MLEQGVLLVLGDATGHGIAPALHVTQMHAMLRMAFRMGADLDTAFVEVNNQLVDALPDDRFITAFIGILDVGTNSLRFHSGGQAPILVFDATSGTCRCLNPTSFPLSVMPLASMPPAVSVEMRAGDMLVLLSDGIYECHDGNGEDFGVERVVEIVRAHAGRTMPQLADALLAAVRAFANGAPQEDDITLVLVKRSGALDSVHRAFARSFDALADIFDFTRYAIGRLDADPALLPIVDLAIEELFTNAVKYSVTSRAEPEITLRSIPGGVEVTLIDHDVDLFDVTRAPEVDIDAPIERREPGGLGLHLVRRMADSLDYHYDHGNRRSRTIFTKALPRRPTTDLPT